MSYRDDPDFMEWATRNEIYASGQGWLDLWAAWKAGRKLDHDLARRLADLVREARDAKLHFGYDGATQAFMSDEWREEADEVLAALEPGVPMAKEDRIDTDNPDRAIGTPPIASSGNAEPPEGGGICPDCGGEMFFDGCRDGKCLLRREGVDL